MKKVFEGYRPFHLVDSDGWEDTTDDETLHVYHMYKNKEDYTGKTKKLRITIEEI